MQQLKRSLAAFAYMTTIQAGEFWVAEIPFTNGAGYKKRPVHTKNLRKSVK
jgi:hypothetical protein